MVIKKSKHTKAVITGNIASFAMFLFLSAAYLLEAMIFDISINYNYVFLFIIIALIIITSILLSSVNNMEQALNVPFVIFIFYTFLLYYSKWQIGHFFIACFALCAVSCIYLNFKKTLVFIIFQNILIGILVLLSQPVNGYNTPMLVLFINWAILLFTGIILLILARAATVSLNKALEHQNSFMDLLSTTENYVAILNERNEIVYASKTMSELSNVNDPLMVQGRSFIDLFPGRTLKVYAAKLLKQKHNYSDDWEFTAHGHKRYFKATSHKLAKASGGTLISLYDMTHLAERDEIAAMKDNMQIGLFFMDNKFIIQNHYSKYLEEMLNEYDLFGKNFTDIISDSVNTNEMSSIKDYLKMVIEQAFDQEMLDDINPLTELNYVNKRTGTRRVFQCAFDLVEYGKNEALILVTIYDITAKAELEKRLLEEEARRQEEMQSVFEVIKVPPDVFNDFMNDMEFEFNTISDIQKEETLTAHETLVKIYQSVHAIKSNAIILGLNIFGRKVHDLESKIKVLREIEGDIPFSKMLDLTIDIEKISNEREGFRDILDRLKSYTTGNAEKKDNFNIFIDSLLQTASNAAENQQKKILLVTNEIDAEAVEKGDKRFIKEILIQLIRNSAAHGIEEPEVRKAAGKNEIGIIKISIKLSDDQKHILIKLTDDGSGLDYKKIAQRALQQKLIKEEDAENKDKLMKVIFTPGFSTSDKEGVLAGRGIGMNLVRDRVKEINGTIKLKSEDEKGTVFLLTIPVL